MKATIPEESYPIAFRKKDSENLGQLLKNRRSVVLVGMKRVGISNFLRFFLNHKDIRNIYIKEENHIFLTVDLNDLVEREIFPFWILTFKRLSDYVEENAHDNEVKKKISQLFLDSIQSQDLFLTIDGIRKSLVLLCDAGYQPTIFFIRFDRIIDAATHAFFSNFQGLIDATQHKLSFVFTSVRPLDTLSANIFTKHALSVFADTLYIKPADKSDVKIIYDTFIDKYHLILPKRTEDELFALVDGYNQYLQFALINLHERTDSQIEKDLLKVLSQDERIVLQSEELWESLTDDEKQVLKKILSHNNISAEEKTKGEYVFKTGLVGSNNLLFSPLFEHFLEERVESKKENHTRDLSKKEHTLLTFLKTNLNEVCEREEIISHVWPEDESMGVSDWAIDRLVARLRNKLKQQGAKEEIITVKTRGYRLVET